MLCNLPGRERGVAERETEASELFVCGGADEARQLNFALGSKDRFTFVGII